MNRLAIALLGASVLVASEAAAQRGLGLADLYPPDEHCLLVPPPAWEGVLDLPTAGRQRLQDDRALALAVRDQLTREPLVQVSALEPGEGLTPEDIDHGGEGLRRTMRWTFELYAKAWADIRAGLLAGAPSFDVRLFAAMQAACPRRALLAVTRDDGGHTRAVVISMITGNRLADIEFDQQP